MHVFNVYTDHGLTVLVFLCSRSVMDPYIVKLIQNRRVHVCHLYIDHVLTVLVFLCFMSVLDPYHCDSYVSRVRKANKTSVSLKNPSALVVSFFSDASHETNRYQWTESVVRVPESLLIPWGLPPRFLTDSWEA